METSITPTSKYNIKLIVVSAFIAGVLFGAQSTSIYFLSKPNPVNAAVLPIGPAPALQSQTQSANYPPSVPTLPVQQKNLAETLGLTGTPSKPSAKELGGDFFVGSTEVDYLVPLDTPTNEAREILASKLLDLPGLTMGNGKKEIIVVFDPLCSVCHELINELRSDNPIAKDVAAKLIPANYFANNKNSQLASLYMLTKNAEGNHDTALKFLIDLVTGNQPSMEPINSIPDFVVRNFDAATMAILQTGSRVPLVIFRDKSTGQLELFSGKPSLEEISMASSMKKSG